MIACFAPRTVAIVLLVALVACVSGNAIVKPAHDERTYRHLQLANGLDVMLVHDPHTAKAAASMDVSTGWWDDPADTPGLAHFVEHMLFLGNKVHPKEGEWRGFLNDHGGSSNAYTSGTNMNFFWKVGQASLETALSRFSNFFKTPLFTQTATTRELKAVNAENSKNLQNDLWRTQQLLQSLSNKTLPYHKFSTGNLHTLGVYSPEELHTKLVAFHAKHFTANKMRLAVLGHHSLDTMQEWVRHIFRDLPAVKPFKPSPPSYTDDLSAQVFNASIQGAKIHVESVAKVSTLSVVFPLPPQTRFYADKSMSYLSDLFGAQGEHSLQSVLKSSGLATSVSSGIRIRATVFDLFQIQVALSVKGLAQQDKVLEQVFSFIRTVEQSGVQDWRWQEASTIASLHFEASNKAPVMEHVSQLSADLARYPAEDLLYAPFKYAQFNPERIAQLLQLMKPERALALCVSKKHRVAMNQTEKWYGTKFSVETFSNELLQTLQTARDSTADNSPFAVPAKNTFIPQDVTVKPEAFPRGPLSFPLMIQDTKSLNGSVRVWHHKDEHFHRPRANVRCKLWSNQMYGSPRDVVLSTIYAKMVSDLLIEPLYQATLSDYDTSVQADVDGFQLSAAGYNSGLKHVVATMAKHFLLHVPAANTSARTSYEERFMLIKEKLADSYHNFVFGQPIATARYDLSVLLANPHWHISQYADALKSITLNEVQAFGQRVVGDMGVECLVTGNVYSSDANAIVAALTDAIPFHSSTTVSRASSMQQMRVGQLDGSYTFWQPAANLHEKNSAVFNYYQYQGSSEHGNASFADDVKTQILATIMSKPAFHTLRTKEALGYMVFSGSMRRSGVNGIQVSVQSPTFPAIYLDKRVDLFMNTTLRATVQALTKSKFAQLRLGMAHYKLHTPSTLASQASEFWSEIVSQQYRFDRKSLEIKALQALKLEQFKAFYDELIGYKAVPAKLSIQVFAREGPAAAHSALVPRTATAGAIQPKGATYNHKRTRVSQTHVESYTHKSSNATEQMFFVELGETREHITCPGDDVRCSCLGSASSILCGKTKLHAIAAIPSFVGHSLAAAVVKPTRSMVSKLMSRLHSKRHTMKLVVKVGATTQMEKKRCKGVRKIARLANGTYTQTETTGCGPQEQQQKEAVVPKGPVDVVKIETKPTTPQWYDVITVKHPVATVCARNVSKTVHSPAPMTLATLTVFKQGLCKLPAQKVGTKLPTPKWWLGVLKYQSAHRKPTLRRVHVYHDGGRIEHATAVSKVTGVTSTQTKTDNPLVRFQQLELEQYSKFQEE